MTQTTRAVPCRTHTGPVPCSEEATELGDQVSCHWLGARIYTLVTSGSLTQGNRHSLEPSRRSRSGDGAPGAEAGVAVGGF